jgi:hypothetical protein
LFFTFLQVTLTFFLATVTVDFAPALVHEAPILTVVVVVVVATDPDEVAAAAIFNVPRFRVYVSPVLEALNA